MPNPIVSLLTDFGRSDGYVGAMEGVILSICPTAAITHLTHLIPPQNIQTAAFVLYQSYNYYPPHAVHCVVVDPGVGSERTAVAFRTPQGVFVGPDNGVFSLVLNDSQVLEAVALANPKYQLKAVSATFHGRDIFSPAAAHLAAGVPLGQLGPPLPQLTRLALFDPPAAGHSRIIHIDHFGNIVLDLTIDQISAPEKLAVTIGHTVIRPLRYTFANVAEGELLAYVGSTRGHIELAARNGSVAQALDLQLGDVVQVTW